MNSDGVSTNAVSRGSALATLADVAELAGVSRWVAGRVLNGGDGNSRYSEKSRQRVLRAARQLNYHPNHAARLLSGKRSRTFGLMVASAGDPLRSFLVQYLDVEAVKIGCQTLICNTIGNPAVGPDQFQRYIDQFARRGVDGVFCAVHHWWPGDRRELLRRFPRTVFYEDPGLPGACCVAVDREEAVRLAVRHLIEQGRRRIGLAVMTLSRPTHTARLRGYQSELASQGRAVDERLIFDAESFGLAFAHCNERSAKWEFPMDVMDRVIDVLVRDAAADAIVAHDDFWAAALVKRMRARGIPVPRDVAVVGYLNHYLADWIDPALTTIDLCHETAARAMVSMLETMITSGPLPEGERVVKVKPRLIVRDSA
jgi:DNA-binding LacI/PurR family transcriptional regulator